MVDCIVRLMVRNVVQEGRVFSLYISERQPPQVPPRNRTNHMGKQTETRWDDQKRTSRSENQGLADLLGLGVNEQ